jgi:hypothetical protein
MGTDSRRKQFAAIVIERQADEVPMLFSFPEMYRCLISFASPDQCEYSFEPTRNICDETNKRQKCQKMHSLIRAQ